MPVGFPSEIQRSVQFEEDTPAGRHLRFAEQLVRQDDEKQISATISHQALELRSAKEPVLQRGRFPENPSIAAMADGIEIVRIIFSKKRIAGAQGGVVNAQMLLQNIAPASERMKALACRRGRAIITAQIGQRLFAFKNCGNGLFAEP